jgi:mono/diheme cytochrome c family protein
MDKITDLNWKAASPEKQLEFGKKAMDQWQVESLQNCSTCHR